MPSPERLSRMTRVLAGGLVLCLGLVLEGLACQYWYATLPDGLLQGLIWHAIAALACAGGLYLLLPPAGGRVGMAAMLLLLCALLPMIGALGLVWWLTVGWWLPHRQPHQALCAIVIPGLPDQHTIPPPAHSQTLREGLASLLLNASASELRQQALIQAQHLPPRHAIRIIRQGVNDSADEVRLLGYSLLNGMEGRLERRLAEARARLAERGDPHGQLCEAIASLYAEYGYLELAQGNALEPLLKDALSYLDRALDSAENASRWYLRARICLMQGAPRACSEALSRAIELGLPRASAALIEAELAYHHRHLPSLRRHLADIDPTGLPSIVRLQDTWQ